MLSPRVQLTAAYSSAPTVAPGVLTLPQVNSDAFGDGSHPTTRLCAAVVDNYCRTIKPARVLDVGTGTGVLARIARARGATTVTGTDICESSLLVARENAAFDSFATEILFANAMPDAWGPNFDLVIANILEGILKELAPALVRAMAPGAALLLSGFTPLQVPGMRITFESLGLKHETTTSLDGWSLLLLRAP